MPGRQSHGGPAPKKASVRTNAKKRSLDAFSIASHQNPDRIKVRQNRLGASEGGNRPNKRRRNVEDDDEDEDEDEDQQDTKKKHKGPVKGRFDELDVDEGSDSEGNEWKMGQVDSDDDSDIDSDEAFGESDEEKFDGYAFSGSTENKKVQKKKPRAQAITLDEDDTDDEPSDSGSGSDDLGDDAIDLAAMLDATEGEEYPVGVDEEHGSSLSGFEDELEDEDDEEMNSDDSGDESSISSVDDVSNPAKLATVQEMVKGLPQKDRSIQRIKDYSSSGPGEKLTMDDFTAVSTTATKRSNKERKEKQLGIPLAKRQQDRLDRSAAYEKTKEELGRWTDTVKHNRRADHLMFPLPDHDVSSAKNNTKLQLTSTAKPFNELEATIQSILEESGLANSAGKYDEDRIREFEDLESNKMSIEEVKSRRDQLRMARELLFREEVKAKRIKKIKSKSYRKVHRKQREKEERMNKEALAEGGFEPSEDELEAQDRRRATERMGQKHRESKWAKATKATGRAAWDDDARAGVTEMARRDEELRKRVEGRVVREAYGNDASSSSESEDSGRDDDSKDDKRLLKKLQSIGRSDQIDDSAPGSKLANMKFMLKAEASRKQDNDAMVEDIRRELAGEAPPSEEETDIGRRIFGPGSQESAKKPKSTKHDFEEPEDSEDEQGHNAEEPKALRPLKVPKPKTTGISKIPERLAIQDKRNEPVEGGAWSKAARKSTSINDAESQRRRHKANNAIEIEELDLSQAAMIATRPKSTNAAKKTTALDVSSDEESGGDETVQLPFVIRDQELIQRAFAGADVVGEFEAEKRQTIIDEDEKIIDNTLPGWGNWTGEGLSKREKARNKGRVLTKVAGVKEGSRKDARLDRVIINEKRVKKVSHDLYCL